jgi:hypothetical protein
VAADGEREWGGATVAGELVLGGAQHTSLDEACSETRDRSATESGRRRQLTAGGRTVVHEVFEHEHRVVAMHGRSRRIVNRGLLDVGHLASMESEASTRTYPVLGTRALGIGSPEDRSGRGDEWSGARGIRATG